MAREVLASDKELASALSKIIKVDAELLERLQQLPNGNREIIKIAILLFWSEFVRKTADMSDHEGMPSLSMIAWHMLSDREFMVRPENGSVLLRIRQHNDSPMLNIRNYEWVN